MEDTLDEALAKLAKKVTLCAHHIAGTKLCVLDQIWQTVNGSGGNLPIRQDPEGLFSCFIGKEVNDELIHFGTDLVLHPIVIGYIAGIVCQFGFTDQIQKIAPLTVVRNADYHPSVLGWIIVPGCGHWMLVPLWARRLSRDEVAGHEGVEEGNHTVV